MARLPRLSVADCPEHIIQRGNNRQAFFLLNAITKYISISSKNPRFNIMFQSIHLF